MESLCYIAKLTSCIIAFKTLWNGQQVTILHWANRYCRVGFASWGLQLKIETNGDLTSKCWSLSLVSFRMENVFVSNDLVHHMFTHILFLMFGIHVNCQYLEGYTVVWIMFKKFINFWYITISPLLLFHNVCTPIDCQLQTQYIPHAPIFVAATYVHVCL